MRTHRSKIAIGVALCIVALTGITVVRANDTGLVAEFSFNEGSGSVAFDSSNRGNTGAVEGATWASGRYGSALTFDGTSDLVLVPNSESLGLGTGMTLEAWIRPQATSDWSTVIMKETPNGLAYSLYASTPYGGGGTWIHPDGSGDVSASRGTKLPLNTWSHVAATYDGKYLRYYENGNLRATTLISKTTARSIIASDGALKIGGNSVWGEWFKGQIDEVRVYNRALSKSEIGSDRVTPIGTVAVASTPTAAPTTAAQSTTPPTIAPTTTAAPTTPASTVAPPTTVAPDPGGLPGLPIGVTLRPVDGGADYFGRWSNSLPTDPSFFPIGVWGESFSDDAVSRGWMDAYAGMGINTQVGTWALPDSMASYLKSTGGYAIGGSASQPSAITTTDEPDWRGCSSSDGNVRAEAPSWIASQCATLGSASGAPASGPVAPSFLQAWADGLRARDPSRPVWTNFTKIEKVGIATDYWVDDDATARAYANTADIVSFDWYPLTDAGYYTPASLGVVWTQHDAVKNVRRILNNTKPVWNAIEMTYVNDYGTYRPTAADVNAEVWNSLIGGARGFTYFQHDFKLGTSRALLDPRFSDIRAQVTVTNARIKGLAPVLNAPYADGLTTVGAGQVNVMTKALGDSFYVFVSPRTKSSQTVSLNLAGLGNTTATVLHENRSVPVTNGTLTDSFADQNSIHIYKVTPGS